MLLAGTSYVRAQEIIDSAPSEQRRVSTDTMKNRRTNLSEEQQNRFINLVRNATNRMEGALLRLENISTRLDARITKIEAQGIDTVEARASLSRATQIIAEAKVSLASIKSGAETGIVSDAPRERFKTSREEFSKVRQSIREAFIAMRESVNILKDTLAVADLNTRESEQ